MVSIEFQLARETARTTWREPELPWGGIPNLTDQDIQFALAMVKHPIGAHLIKAKYADNQRSSLLVSDWCAEQSLAIWRGNSSLKSKPVSILTLERVAELAVLYAIMPKARQRTDEMNINYCGTSKTMWKYCLAAHHGKLWNQLESIARYSVKEVKDFLYGN